MQDLFSRTQESRRVIARFFPIKIGGEEWREREREREKEGEAGSIDEEEEEGTSGRLFIIRQSA